MAYTLYDHVDEAGTNTFKEWTEGLQRKERAKLNAKLDMLVTAGADLPTGLLSGTSHGHIRKLRINGDVAPRPMLCAGPVKDGEEFTLLVGATEKDRKLDPADAYNRAEKLRKEVAASPGTRRRLHERVA